ncbi:ABC transporter substrate-binding protein [Uliginosibacterium sp. H1]|uniref:ABC transporter substrate-binding protein n=1 Tax=Uliginosibacterium sp. H1 TaxID=3114757 RepID=UPI002E197848|nr:ABC transporter substrate-binding protein [Uliginosibacterium sp. H1]
MSLRFLSLLLATTFSLSAPVALHAAPRTTLVLAVSGEPAYGYDPVKGWGRYGNTLFQSTLLKRDAKLNIVGDLATEWKASADRKLWTVKLREDVKFSDGRPLTAEDVAFTFETTRKEAGTVDLTVLESVRAVDARSVEFRLTQPRVTFLNMMVTLGIVPKHAYGPDYGQKPIGSGPFRLVSWAQGQQLIIEPNPNHHGSKPAFTRITFLFTKEDATYAAARAGQLDLAAVPATLAANVPPNMKRVAVDTVDNRGLLFPMQPAKGEKTPNGATIGNDVTADLAIRQAVNLSLDRKALAAGVLNGFGSPAWGPADGLPWDNPEQRLPDTNPAAARELLLRAGWKPSTSASTSANASGALEKDGVIARFTIVYPASDGTRQALALAAADMIRKSGIQVDVAGKAWDEIKLLAHSNVVVFGWGSHDPQEIYNLFSAGASGKGYFNAGYYRNATVNANLEKAQQAASLQESLPHWRAAAWDGKTGFGMKGDATWAWLVNLDHVYFVNPCLDIGPRQIEPHGHGFPVTWNLQDWRWTCN